MASPEFDLDVDDRRPAAPSGARPGPGGGGGSEFAAEDIGLLDVGLEDDRPAPSSSQSSRGPSGSPVPLTGAPASSRAANPSAPLGSAAYSEPSASDPFEVPFYEVEALAAYGTPPFEWLPSVPYAVRALRRRLELQKRLTEVRKESESGRRGVQGRMVPLLESVHERHAGDDAMALILRPVHEILAQLASQTAALSLAGERHRAEVSALEAELASRKIEKEQLLPERRTAQVFVEDATSKVARAKSELARLNRDLSLAHDEAAQAAGQGEFAPPEHARRIADLEGQRTSAATALGDAERGLAERRVQLGQVEQRLAQTERSIAEVHSRRKAVDMSADAERRQGEKAIKTADFQRLDACEGALRRIVTAHGDRLGPEQQRQFADLEKELRLLEREVQRYALAVSAYNAQAFQRGLTLLGGAFAVLVVLVVLLVR